MRESKKEFLEICHDVKCFLQLSSYTIHDYDDGCTAEFKVRNIKDPRGLGLITNRLEFCIIADENQVIIRIFESFKEYEPGRGASPYH